MIVSCRGRGTRHKAARMRLTSWLKLALSESRDEEENDALGYASSAPTCVCRRVARTLADDILYQSRAQNLFKTDTRL